MRRSHRRQAALQLDSFTLDLTEADLLADLDPGWLVARHVAERPNPSAAEAVEER